MGSDPDNDPMEEELPPLRAGELRFQIEDRIFLTDQTNAIVGGEIMTIVGFDGLSGEGLTMIIAGQSIDVYQFNDTNTASFSPSFVDQPFTTQTHTGGGFVEITEMDMSGLSVSGFFNITAYRERQDNEGNPILDENGNPIFDSVELTNGEFYMISLNI